MKQKRKILIIQNHSKTIVKLYQITIKQKSNGVMVK